MSNTTVGQTLTWVDKTKSILKPSGDQNQTELRSPKMIKPNTNTGFKEVTQQTKDYPLSVIMKSQKPQGVWFFTVASGKKLDQQCSKTVMTTMTTLMPPRNKKLTIFGHSTAVNKRICNDHQQAPWTAGSHLKSPQTMPIGHNNLPRCIHIGESEKTQQSCIRSALHL